MNYYKIDVKTHYTELERISSSANGENVPNGESYFGKIRNGEIIKDTPVFDYFIMESFDEKKYWEWALFDVHDGMGDYPGNSNWYISENFKNLLENFKIAPKYHFYETRLLYKGKKLNYWIFQFPIEPLKNIDFENSTFVLEGDECLYRFSSKEAFVDFYRKEYKKSKRKLKILSQVFKSSYDLFLTTHNDKVVSENLKQAIEDNGITGFEFSDLNYEVVVGFK